MQTDGMKRARRFTELTPEMQKRMEQITALGEMPPIGPPPDDTPPNEVDELAALRSRLQIAIVGLEEIKRETECTCGPIHFRHNKDCFAGICYDVTELLAKIKEPTNGR